MNNGPSSETQPPVPDASQKTTIQKEWTLLCGNCLACNNTEREKEKRIRHAICHGVPAALIASVPVVGILAVPGFALAAKNAYLAYTAHTRANDFAKGAMVSEGRIEELSGFNGSVREYCRHSCHNNSRPTWTNPKYAKTGGVLNSIIK